jgi:peptidoglycan/LPS O-acetylase OafA/YrhL
MEGSSVRSSRSAELALAAHQPVIAGVDAMRALAIVMVLGFHLFGVLSGALGVMIFFVLSGFLITSVLLKDIRRTGTISFKDFYRRRAFRIFPNFYAAWLLEFLVFHVNHQAIVKWQAATAFFYVSNYGRALLSLEEQGRYFMTISWSLAVEEQFYLLWPAALLLAMRYRKHASKIITGMIAVIWIWRFVRMECFGVGWAYAYNAFEMRADALLAGALLAMLLYAGDAPEWLSFATAKKGLAVLPLLFFAAVTYAELKQLPMGLAVQILNLSLQPLVAACALVQWMYWGHRGWRFLEHPAIKWVARLSYSYYLYHLSIRSLVQGHIHVLHAQRIVGTVAVVLLPVIPYYLIERPFMKWRDRGRKPSPLLDDGLHHPAAG